MQEVLQIFQLHPLRILKNAQTVWSYQMLQSLNKIYGQEIREALIASSTLKQFIQKHEDKILDVIARKEDFYKYFELIKNNMELMIGQKDEQFKQMQKNQLKNKNDEQFKQLKNKNKKFKQMYKNCNFQEFMNLLISTNKQKTKLAINLMDIKCPIPILYQLEEACVYDPSILKDIFLNKGSHLIFHLRSQRAQKERQMILKKMFSLDQNYLQNHQAKNYLNIFASEKVSVADLSCAGLQNKEGTGKQKFAEFLCQILEVNSFIILLVTEEDVQNNFLRMNALIQKACQRKYKLLILCIIKNVQVSDSDSEDDSNAKILQKKILEQLPSSNLIIEIITATLDSIKADNIHKKIEEQLDKIEKKFSYQIFGQLTTKQKLYYKKVAQIVRQLEKNRKNLLPHMFLKQKIYEKKENLSVFDFKRKQKIIQNNQAIAKLDKQIKSLSLSPFVNKLLQYLPDQTFRAIFLYQLQQRKKNFLPDLVSSQLSLIEQRQKNSRDKSITKQIKQHNNKKLTQKINQIQNAKSEYDITIEKIINEIVIYNTKNNSPDQKTTKLIKDLYFHALKNNNPLNLIDGASLEFGNKHLQEILHQINKQYRQKNKEIYVVSVVGAQSSAKSTLLKYLFGSNFQIGAGRCTKGVYFGLCQVENIAIVVIDTEGLLSPVGRDKVFDQQIITFVLKFSNLIILNCKGQISAILRDMLELCMYVIYLMNKSQKIIDDHPRRLIFVLRDQLKPNNQIQNEMLGTILDNFSQLRDQYNLNYTDYFKIDTNDIISLPSAYDEKQEINYQITPNIMFGKYILFLRNVLVNRLREQQQYKRRDLESVYTEGKNLWNIIQSCGKDLMYFKQLYFAKERQKLQTIYYNIQANKLQDFQTKFEEETKKLEALSIAEALQKINQIKFFIQNVLKQIKFQFQEQFNQQCQVKSQQLLKPFHQKILEFIDYLKYSRKQRLAEKQNMLQTELQVQSFQDKIDKQIFKIIDSDSPQKIKAIEELIQKSKKQINENKEEMCKKIDQKMELHKNQINQILNQIYSTQQIKSSLKINSIVECFKQAQKWQKLSNPEDINDQFFSNWRQFLQQIPKNGDIYRCIEQKWISLNWYFYGSTYQPKQQIYLKKIVKRKVNDLEKLINKQGALKIIKSIRQIVILLYKEVEGFIQSLQQTMAIQLKINFGNIKLNRSNVKKLLLGKIFIYLINFCVSQLKRNEQMKVRKHLLKMDQKNKLVGIMLDTKKSFQEKIGTIQQSIVDKVCKQIIKIHNQNINSGINNIVDKFKLNLEKFKQQGIDKSIKLDHNGKQKWKQCFKFICNQNKFLLELLCQKEEITKDKAFIDLRINERAQNFLKEQIQKLTNRQTALRYLKEKFYLQMHVHEQAQEKIYQKFTLTMKDKEKQMLNKIQDLLKQNKQFNDQRQIKQTIQKKISQEMIGCYHQCPLCSAKCKKSYNHQGDHEIQKGGHLMKAFKGIQYENSNHPSTGTCFTLSEIKRRFNSNIRKYKNNVQYINAQHPSWSKHFKESSLCQNVNNQANLQKIWANVSDMLIKHKFKTMVQNNIFANQKKDELTEQDLDEKYINYLGDVTSLRGYL